jgi:hypothetical protein
VAALRSRAGWEGTPERMTNAKRAGDDTFLKKQNMQGVMSAIGQNSRLQSCISGLLRVR